MKLDLGCGENKHKGFVGVGEVRQEKLLDETNWDLLIVLDACRYDYFREIYLKYLEGNLKKTISPASNTMEWCRKVVGDYRFKEDVCISANPHINSKTPVGNVGWDPRDKFKKIYDVWLTDWSDEMPTVMPENMAERTLEVAETRSERVISWFIQPHAPYIPAHVGGVNPFPRKQKGVRGALKVGGNLSGVRKTIGEFIEIFLPLPLLKKWWEYQVNVRGVSVGPDRTTFAILSIQEMREAYMNNLKLALRNVSMLIEKIKDMDIVITADHGELLGDNKFFGKKIGHPAGHGYPELREVPWLEVDGVAR